REELRAELVAALERFLDDDVAVGHQQRILALVELAGLDQRLDEAVPDRLRCIDRAVRGDAELLGARFDVVALADRYAAGVGEHRVHGVAAFLEVRHAEARVETARKREHDVLAHFASPFWLTSAAMIAFCTWRRFSASSMAMH